MPVRSRQGPARVRVVGRVGQESVWTAEDLDELPDFVDDLGTIVEGFVGRAVPIAPLLERADGDASHVTVVSDDGHYRASIPLAELSLGWLAYRLGQRPLPRSMGGPFRVVVPQGSTLCWNVKSVAELAVTDRKEPDSVPERPKH